MECCLLPIQYTEKGILNTHRSHYIVAFLGIILKKYIFFVLPRLPTLSSVFLLDWGFLKVFDILETEAAYLEFLWESWENARYLCLLPRHPSPAGTDSIFLHLSKSLQVLQVTWQHYASISWKAFCSFSMFRSLPAIEADHLQQCRYEDQ